MLMKIALRLFVLMWLLQACSVSKKIEKQANQLLLQDSVVSTGHIGISIYDAEAQQYLFNHHAAKLFTPASNTKLFTLYAGLKYLGDSLVAARCQVAGNRLFIKPTADPTFLHPDFAEQPLLNLMKAADYISIDPPATNVKPYGSGWSWDDYDQGYHAERSSFPVYGNMLWLSQKDFALGGKVQDTIVGRLVPLPKQKLYILPGLFANKIYTANQPEYLRDKNSNIFYADSIAGEETIPFVTNNGQTALQILGHLLQKQVNFGGSYLNGYTTIKSQPTDSMLKPMMHISDNFFAEQTLLMAAQEKLGQMNEYAIIDTLLKTHLANLPQKPTWADGSGLSRYNLFSPQDFVHLLLQMKKEFGMPRLQNILPTGGKGTLANYYLQDSGYIFAKTGTLSGVVCLSGYMITPKNRLLVFSVLTNNFKGRATAVRRAVEKFLHELRIKH
jgi:D-alanyl-D-alanine carboxypeptidase/D-alanyl-D-alanine-endopeptidase (penicillin-binding protein 4)